MLQIELPLLDDTQWFHTRFLRLVLQTKSYCLAVLLTKTIKTSTKTCSGPVRLSLPSFPCYTVGFWTSTGHAVKWCFNVFPSSNQCKATCLTANIIEGSCDWRLLPLDFLFSVSQSEPCIWAIKQHQASKLIAEVCWQAPDLATGELLPPINTHTEKQGDNPSAEPAFPQERRGCVEREMCWLVCETVSIRPRRFGRFKEIH